MLNLILPSSNLQDILHNSLRSQFLPKDGNSADIVELLPIEHWSLTATGRSVT